MKIKVKVSDKDRDWIEQQEQNYINALAREEKRHIQEVKDIKKRLADYRKFWAANAKPIHQYKNRTGGLGFYETKTEWRKYKEVNINTLKSESERVCKYCGQIPATKYIATGHDHTDYSYDTCDCAGAKKNGKPWKDLI